MLVSFIWCIKAFLEEKESLDAFLVFFWFLGWWLIHDHGLKVII